MTNDRVGSVNGPLEALFAGGGPEFVLLGVVKIRYRQPRLILPERSVRHLPGGVGFERTKVVLQAGHEGNMLDRRVNEGFQ